MDFSEINDTYKSRLPNFKHLEEEAVFILKKYTEKMKIYNILSRIKTLDSFKEKIIRGDYDDPFNQINDILGIRIIALFRSDLEKLSEIIRGQFDLITENNKIDEVAVDSFGYLSVHFIVTLKLKYSGPRYDGIHDIPFEIQTRTIAMDAWANISHFLDYKSSKEVPKELRKDFYALSGLFYLADTHFEMFYEARLDSGKKYQKRMKSETDFAGQEINLDTLKAYLDKKYPKREKIKVAEVSELLKELYKCGYTTLDKLYEDLTHTKKAFEKYEQEHPPANTKYYAPSGVVRVSLAIINKEFRKMRYPKSTVEYNNYENYITR